MGSHPLKSTLPSIRDSPMKPSLIFTCALGPFMQTLSSKTLLPDTPWKKQLTCLPHTPAQRQTCVSARQGIDRATFVTMHHQSVFVMAEEWGCCAPISWKRLRWMERREG